MVGLESGFCGEMAFVGRLFIVQNITVFILPGGLCREVAFIGRWPLVEVRLYIFHYCVFDYTLSGNQDLKEDCSSSLRKCFFFHA